MHHSLRWLVFSSMACFVSGIATAQFVESEPNGSTSIPDVIVGFTSGQTITGNSVSASSEGQDFFDITIAGAAAGIYRHQLQLTTAGPEGHSGALWGLAQTGGVVGTCPNLGTSPSIMPSSVSVQNSSTLSTPPRTNVWYGFGKGERFYYRVNGTTGSTTTTADYVSTLTTTAVTPTVIPGIFRDGPISISTVGRSTSDTEILVLDANFEPVFQAGSGHFMNDNEQCSESGGPSLSQQSRLVRIFLPGTYYLGIGGSDMKNNKPAPMDERDMSGTVLNFANMVCTSISGNTAVIDCDFRMHGEAFEYQTENVYTSKPFEIVWYQFTVGSSNITEFCSPLFSPSPVCPCSNPPVALFRGCNNSAGSGGASIVAGGVAAVANDSLYFSTSNQTANGTTVVLQGSLTQAFTGFGQGVRCITGALKRLYVKSPGGDGAVVAPTLGDPKVATQSANLGDPIAPGTTRYYMAYYRDPIVLGGCAASATFNATNALQVVWQ